jgi:hypothetical protein
MRSQLFFLTFGLVGLVLAACSGGSASDSGSAQADTVAAPGGNAPYRCQAADTSEPDSDPFTLTLASDGAGAAPSVSIVSDGVQRTGKLAPPLPLPQVSDPAKSPIAKAIAAKNKKFDRYTGFDGFDDDATATFFISKAIAETHAATGTVEVDLVLPQGVPSVGSSALMFTCAKLAATCKAFPKCGPGQSVDSATCSCVTNATSSH